MCIRDSPVTGERLSIKNIETSWVGSDIEVKKGALPDKEYIPRATITIHKKSTTGKVRCFFLDGDGKYVGDPITKTFTDGTFEGSKTLEYVCTEGFETESAFDAYFSGYAKPWQLLILEGSEESNTLSQFDELARLKISNEFTLNKITNDSSQ